MIRAYIDQNFLINCANSADLHDRALHAVGAAAVSFVLSPWHFYEIGKLNAQRSDELMEIAESLKPEWILDRSDLQVGEFHEAWSSFMGSRAGSSGPSEPCHTSPAPSFALTPSRSRD